MSLFSEQEMAAVRAGDLPVLAALDARGLCPGPGEDAAAFAERLGKLEKNLAGLETELAEKGKADLGDLVIHPGGRIDPALFAEAGETTERLFSFRVDWVPGFYIDPRFSWLFGGCAFSDRDDFFALFIIRKAFATSPRWFMYNRRELLAHELTHIARIALDAERYEERFAYQTAETPFRKKYGGVFRSQADSFTLVISTLLLVGAQVTQSLWLPGLPVWLFWLGVAGVFLRLGVRHARTGREFDGALAKLAPGFGDRALAVLCRCTDREVRELAALRTPQAVDDWLEARRAGGELRWQVIRARFG